MVFLFLLALIAAGGYFGYDWHIRREQEAFRQLQENEARALAQRLAIGVRGITAPLDDAIDPVTLGALLNSGDDTGLAATIAEIAAADENVISARMLEPGHSQIDYDSTPPLSYATLDLLRRSERMGRRRPWRST